MMTHVVLLKLRPDVSSEAAAAVFASLDRLRETISGLLSFSGGPYSSPEGLNRGFTHRFCMSFRDAKARDRYLDHPEHEKVKAEGLALLDGGLDAVLAFDYES